MPTNPQLLPPSRRQIAVREVQQTLSSPTLRIVALIVLGFILGRV